MIRFVAAPANHDLRYRQGSPCLIRISAWPG